MKFLLFLSIIFSMLNASMFSSDNANKQTSMIEEFRQNVNDVNSIIWRGEYDKLSTQKSTLTSIIKNIDSLSISQDSKKQLKNDLQNYAHLVNTISTSLQKEAPTLNKHYNETIIKLDSFNKKISSIGLYQLTALWKELSKIKNEFVKKPNLSYEKKFEDTWNEMSVTIMELYLNDETEEFLFGYLEHYKQYFKEINLAYKQANYENINQLKPLSYKIKAAFELL